MNTGSHCGWDYMNKIEPVRIPTSSGEELIVSPLSEELFDGCWGREALIMRKWWRDRKGIGGEKTSCGFEPNTLHACLKIR